MRSTWQFVSVTELNKVSETRSAASPHSKCDIRRRCDAYLRFIAALESAMTLCLYLPGFTRVLNYVAWWQTHNGVKTCPRLLRSSPDFDCGSVWNLYEERLAILNTENIKICGWTTKLEAIKMQYVCISAISAEYLQKIWIFNFPR